MRGAIRKAWLSVLCAAAVSLAASAPEARGAASDPLFVLVPSPPAPPAPPVPPPTGYFNGPCGLAVDMSGRFYVSDYYHHVVDVYSSGPGYVTQLPNVDPSNGPCGLALDSANGLYVNNYHRNVTKYNASPSFGTGTVFPLPSEDTSHHLPTGVAVDTESNTVYVNNRTYISVYDSSGNPVLDEGEPLKIGVDPLADYYGLAVSQFEGTLGRLYVPDASTNTVKVYDPAADKVNPVATIKDPFGKPFVSLRDSAIAVDRATGEIYFADNTQPQYSEKPQAIVYVYRADNTWRGYLKYKIIDALPPGLAVDNSAGATQGRVYVTSGNTNQAGVYAYPPGVATTAAPLPPSVGLSVSVAGSGTGSVTNAAAKLDCEGTCWRELLSAGTASLTASPDPGSEFAGWSGACSGTQPTCTVMMEQEASVVAIFSDISTSPVSAEPPLAALALAASTGAETRPPKRRARHRSKRRHQRKRRHRASRPRRVRGS